MGKRVARTVAAAVALTTGLMLGAPGLASAHGPSAAVIAPNSCQSKPATFYGNYTYRFYCTQTHPIYDYIYQFSAGPWSGYFTYYTASGQTNTQDFCDNDFLVVDNTVYNVYLSPSKEWWCK